MKETPLRAIGIAMKKLKQQLYLANLVICLVKNRNLVVHYIHSLRSNKMTFYL